MNTTDFGTFLAIIGALTAVTNIVTEVLKKLTWDKIPTNILVVVIAEVLTVGSCAAYSGITSTPLVWYHVAAAVVVGLFVAYAAMFGFDKLKQALVQMGVSNNAKQS